MVTPYLFPGIAAASRPFLAQGESLEFKTDELSVDEEKARAQKWCIDSVTGNVRRCTDPKEDAKKAKQDSGFSDVFLGGSDLGLLLMMGLKKCFFLNCMVILMQIQLS